MRACVLKWAGVLYGVLCILFWLWLQGHIFFPLWPPPGKWANVLAISVFAGYTIFSATGTILCVLLLLAKREVLAPFGVAVVLSLLFTLSHGTAVNSLGSFATFVFMLISMTSALYLLLEPFLGKSG